MPATVLDVTALAGARALKSGPSPSDARVEAGAAIQSLRNSPLPRAKSRLPSKPRFAEGCEKALALTVASEVAAPPDMRS